MNDIPQIVLNNGIAMPQLGLGVWQISDSDMPVVVKTALESGYRSFDTAAIYGNEASLGHALRMSGIARSELFVTTKLWNDRQGEKSALKAFDESLKRLGLDYVDLYLIHWPHPAANKYVETWAALEALHRDGRARAIGVSNFHTPHLERVLAKATIVPAVNQIELHPGLQQADLRAFDAAHAIATESWSPLARGDLGHPTLAEIAAKYRKTAAQIVLRWHVELGLIVIPRSRNPARIRENAAIFDFALGTEDKAAIAALERYQRVGPNPDTF